MINNEYGTDKCGLLCGGLHDGICGGLFSLSVFRRTVVADYGPAPLLSPGGPRYLGCYDGFVYLEAVLVSSLIPIFPLAAVTTYGTTSSSTNKITIEKCLAFCASRGYTYTTPYEDTCYCANTKPAELLRVGPGHCTSIPCRGNTAQSCGGRNNYNTIILNYKMIGLYLTSPPPVITTTPPTIGTDAGSGYKYQGCYTGGLYLLDTMITGATFVEPTDASTCIARCLAATPAYDFALTLGGTCFCQRYGPTSDLLTTAANCDEPCTKTSTQRCGGFDTSSDFGSACISVYGIKRVSGFQYVFRLLLCSELCSALVLAWIALGRYDPVRGILQQKNTIMQVMVKFLVILVSLDSPRCRELMMLQGPLFLFASLASNSHKECCEILTQPTRKWIGSDITRYQALLLYSLPISLFWFFISSSNIT